MIFNPISLLISKLCIVGRDWHACATLCIYGSVGTSSGWRLWIRRVVNLSQHIGAQNTLFLKYPEMTCILSAAGAYGLTHLSPFQCGTYGKKKSIPFCWWTHPHACWSKALVCSLWPPFQLLGVKVFPQKEIEEFVKSYIIPPIRIPTILNRSWWTGKLSYFYMNVFDSLIEENIFGWIPL